MAIKSVQLYGDQLVVFSDDGSKTMCFASSNGFWVPRTGTGTPPVDPPPVGSGDGTMIDPFPGRYDASDPFGNVRPSGNAHTGSDWGNASGTPIPAVCDGTIITAEWNDTVGNYLCIKANGISPAPEYPVGTDVYIYYYHMVEPAHLPVGSVVTKGQANIGAVGNTGTSSQGSHLHISISNSSNVFNGQSTKRDPYAFIHARI